MNFKFLLLFLVRVIGLFHCVPRVLGTPIIGGFLDPDRSFNYHVSIHKIYSQKTGHEYYCGGTIIHIKHILTTARCFMVRESHRATNSINIAQEQPKIIAGTNERDGPGIERYIVTIYIPNNYQSFPRYQANIAVAQLEGDLVMGQNGRTFEILNIGELPPNEANNEATFCGFGRYLLQRPGYSKLNRYLTVTLLGESTCPNSQICSVASNKLETRTNCEGDTGAGLIYDHKIVGVLSHGPILCDTNKVPIVFMRLSSFKEQIDRAMNENANHDDMYIISEGVIPHKSPVHQARPSSPHNEERSDKWLDLHTPHLLYKKHNKN